MAKVGDQLLQPEIGWRRIDDRDALITYSNDWTETTDGSPYNNTRKFRAFDTIDKAFYSFYFYGSKLRIITSNCQPINVYIDGIKYESVKTLFTNPQTIMFEKTDLDLKSHIVKITNATDLSGNTAIVADAIDIDSDGKLLAPKLTDILKEALTLKDIKKGECIRARYTTTKSNTVGIITSVGCIGNDKFLSTTTPSTTADGMFYLICVGYDTKGRAKLIADRILQNGISWDAINNKCLVNECQHDYPIDLPIVSSWELNESTGTVAYDKTGMNNGTYIGTTSMNEDGIYFRRFNSTSDILNMSSTVIPYGDKTIKLKVRTTEPCLQSTLMTNAIGSTTTLPTAFGWSVHLVNGSLNVTFYNGNNTNNKITCNTNNIINDGQWHDITILFNHNLVNDNLTIKVDKNDYLFTVSEIVGNISSNLSIGGTNNATFPDKFKGDIAKVQIYNGVVTDINNPNYTTYSRLLSGGVSASDKENEWDKIICEYDLGGLITPKQQNIWNWIPNQWELTSSTPSSLDAVRVVRGQLNGNSFGWIAPGNDIVLSTSYRPVVLLDTLSTLKFSIDSITADDYYLPFTIKYTLDDSIEKPYSIEIKVNNILIQTITDQVGHNEYSLNLESIWDTLKYGNNTIEIIAIDTILAKQSDFINFNIICQDMIYNNVFKNSTLKYQYTLVPESIYNYNKEIVGNKIDAEFILDIYDINMFKSNIKINTNIADYKFLIMQDNKYYSILESNYNTVTQQFNQLLDKNFDQGSLSVDDLFKTIVINNESFRPIDKFYSSDLKLLVLVNDSNIMNFNISITGNIECPFNYKILANNKVIEINGKKQTSIITSEFTVPEEVIYNNYSSMTDVPITFEKTNLLDNNVTRFSTIIPVNPQRLFSKYFEGINSKIEIPNWSKPLSELTIQVIKKSSTDSDFICITDNSLISLSNNILKIGGSFTGNIYEVRVWLKDKEIPYDYKQLIGNEDGLYALYRLNEYRGNNIYDSCSNKLHGTYISAVVKNEELIPFNASYLTMPIIDIKNEDIVEQNKDYEFNYDIIGPKSCEYNVISSDITNDEIDMNYIDQYYNIENIDIENIYKNKPIELIPTMENNESVYMKITSSSYYTSYGGTSFYPYLCCDKNINTMWNYQNASQPVGGHWINVQFKTVKQCVKKISLRNSTSASASVKDFEFYASNDGINYKLLYTDTHMYKDTDNTISYYSFNNQEYYYHYKLVIKTSHYVTNPIAYGGLSELQFYSENDFLILNCNNSYYSIDNKKNIYKLKETDNKLDNLFKKNNINYFLNTSILFRKYPISREDLPINKLSNFLLKDQYYISINSVSNTNCKYLIKDDLNIYTLNPLRLISANGEYTIEDIENATNNVSISKEELDTLSNNSILMCYNNEIISELVFNILLDRSFITTLEGDKKLICELNTKDISTDIVYSGISNSEYYYKINIDETLIKQKGSMFNNIKDSAIIPKSIFITSENPYNVKLEIIDEKISRYSTTTALTLHNTEPDMIISMFNMLAKINFDDPDKNKIKYRVLLNGKQISPVTGMWTDFIQTPFSSSIKFKSEDLVVNGNNTVKVIAEDQYGKVGQLDYNFIGKISGLLFVDEENNIYSDDLGNIIKTMNIGRINAGKQSEIKKVILKNTCGYDVKDVNISLSQDNVYNHYDICISRESDNVSYKNIYIDKINNNESIDIYILVTTNPEIENGGAFYIDVTSTACEG